MRIANLIVVIASLFTSAPLVAQTSPDYSSIIPGAWVMIESLPTSEIEEPENTSYIKYVFVLDSTFYYGTNPFELGTRGKYSLVGDTIVMYNTKYRIQSFHHGELKMQARIKHLNQTRDVILVRKEKYDSIWKLRRPNSLAEGRTKPIFTGNFHLYHYVFSEFTTPQKYAQDLLLRPFRFVVPPPRHDRYLKIRMTIDSAGNVAVGNVTAIPKISRRRIEKITRKMENTSGYWNPSRQKGANVSDSVHLTLLVQGETSLKIKSKTIRFFRSAYTSFHKQDYAAAVLDLNSAINLAPDKFYFYLFRAACYLHVNDIEKYCKDMYKAYALHPMVKLENVEVVNGESIYINCDED